MGFVTAVSDDDLGRMCQSELGNAGVDLSRRLAARCAQSAVTVHLQHEKLRHMFTYAGAASDLTYDDLDLSYLADARHFHMSSYYLQRALTPRIPELFAELKKAGVTLSLDPNDDPTQGWDRGILDAIRPGGCADAERARSGVYWPANRIWITRSACCASWFRC